MTAGRRWFAGAAATVLIGSLCAGFGGSAGAATPRHQRPAPSTRPARSGAARQMTFRLAASTAGPVTASVPRHPVATTPTTITGTTLQLYEAKRLSGDAVLVVFALVAPANADRASVIGALSANGGGSSASVSGVALLDTTGLKEYLPYMGNPSEDGTCVCSNSIDSDIGMGSNQSTEPVTTYYAAVLSAPPASVNTVSFVTGLGTIPDVTLSR